jgi:hypothetical protein
MMTSRFLTARNVCGVVGVAVAGTLCGMHHENDWECERRVERAFARGVCSEDPGSSEDVSRTQLHEAIQHVLKPPHNVETFGVIYGQHGTGKTRAVQRAVQQTVRAAQQRAAAGDRTPCGVIYVSASDSDACEELFRWEVGEPRRNNKNNKNNKNTTRTQQP